MNKRPMFAIFAVSVLVVVTLACGESTPQVRVPEATLELTLEPREHSIPTPTTALLGSARSNPAPRGTEVDIGGLTLSIGEVIRPANEMIAEANEFGIDLKSGNEFLALTLNATCNLSADEICSIFSISEFSLVGSSGIVYDPDFLSSYDLDNKFEDGEMFGGVSRTGWLVYEINEGETNLTLIYREFLSFSEVYLVVE